MILHASDLHFGAHIPEILAQFSNFANSLLPRLVVLSGDLTDGGRASEYGELAVYLRTFNCPVFIVPGNHDAPVDNLLTRFMSPFVHFDALPSYKNSFHGAGIEVAELRTAGPVQFRFDWSKGVTTKPCVERALGSFTRSRAHTSSRAPKPWRIVVGHHPLVDTPHAKVPGDVIGGSQALLACAELGVDLVLSGHTHQSWFGKLDPNPILLGTAPTLSSPRIRGEGQGFHAYSFSDHEVLCDVWRWDVTDFAIETSKVHQRRGDLHEIGEPTIG
jgi:3',5'-cyclic AMP phosphodiesterase CpdA